ncbi:signal peptide peptidase SppA [Longimonas halophila]|uniref:Signal peptide peptidase SppA n=1 Tax=Longimonas halophila TaxID=1469170 RepID=A0A2H3NL40_9BACT|nr:signal peptide peptidase SppA [Longimonas halophila]PEN06559.1 signal peptide peptidase SppA [Longimonas halophila]
MRFLSTLLASVLGTLIALGGIIVFFVLFFFAIALSSESTPTVQPSSVLVIDVNGDIPERMANDPIAQALGDGPSFDMTDANSALRKAAADERIDGVWLRIRSATSGWARLDDLRESIATFKESGKPVIASGTDAGMGEKELYLATAADSVFIPPVSMFQMNGFYTSQPFFSNALERLDIEPKIVRVGEFKAAVEPFLRDDLSEENRLQLQALLESQNDQFSEEVGSGRGMEATEIRRLASEDPVLSAEAAYEAGLVDALLYPNEIEDAIRERTGASSLTTVGVSQYAGVPAEEAGLSVAENGSVAVVYVEGNIVPGGEPTAFGDQQTAASEPFIEAMNEARTSSDVYAIVVRVNSPGGSAAASEVMWNALRRAANEKPVIVSMGDVAASGGYYLAAGADTIIAQENTITGSIGVFGVFFNASGFLENELGITFDAVQTSPYADIYSGVQPFRDDEQQRLEESTRQVYDTFLKRVADGRGMDRSAVEEIAGGRVWSGRDAQEVGLVDEIGSLSLAVQRAAEAANMGEGPYRIRVLPRPKTFFERFNESLNTSVHHRLRALTTTEIERTFLEQRQALERLVGTHGTIQARLPVDIRFE